MNLILSTNKVKFQDDLFWFMSWKKMTIARVDIYNDRTIVRINNISSKMITIIKDVRC